MTIHRLGKKSLKSYALQIKKCWRLENQSPSKQSRNSLPVWTSCESYCYKSFPVHSSLVQTISAYSSLFQPISAFSILFQSVPVYSLIYQCIKAYSSISQPIPTKSNLLQLLWSSLCTISVHKFTKWPNIVITNSKKLHIM